MQCEHEGLELECNGNASLTKFGYLCRAHAYRAFLHARSGLEVHQDGYSAKTDDYAGTMFDDVEGDE